MDTDQQKREECRREVRRYLVARQHLAMPADAIRRKLRIDGDDFTEAEILAALTYLAQIDPPHVTILPDPDGASKYYQATSAGVLAHERRA